MKLKRRFYDSIVRLKNISKRRLILGTVLGVFSSFVIYGFQYVIREAFRLMSYSFANFPNILSGNERFIFNWFLASLSVIIGNSIAVSFIFSLNKEGFIERNIKKRRIVNDQTFLNSAFIYWYAKVGFVIGVFSMGFADFNFIPKFTIPMILLVLVLYFETWKTLILMLEKHKYKYLILHFLVFCLFSFGLSNIEFIDYKKLDSIQLKHNPILDLPKSNFSNLDYRDEYLSFKAFFNNTDQDVLSFGDYKNDLNESYTDFLDFRLSLREEQQPFASVVIFADGSTKMKTINLIQNQIIKSEVNNVIYATQNNIYAKRFTINGLKSKVLKKDCNDEVHLKDTLIISIDKNIEMTEEMLVNEFENNINKKTLFEYKYSTNTEYQNYIKVISAHFQAIHNLRRRNEKVVFKSEWRNGHLFSNEKDYRKDQNRVRDKYPILIIENIN